tara:strand:+ start:1814 stop:3724 length:1911 start_codon:yes stop_codon:yes gene_type:complete
MASEQRERPYSIDRVQWKDILDDSLLIPMNQRKYEWGEVEIMPVLNDIYEMYNREYPIRMGSLMCYKNESMEIWDGQQRLLTMTLIILALSNIYDKTADKKNMKEKMLSKITLDPDFDKHKIQKKIKYINAYPNYINKESIDDIIIPNIHCINDNDTIALVNIFNDHKPILSYYDKIDDNKQINNINDDNIKNKYKCKECEKEYYQFKRLITHLIKEHKLHDKYKIIDEDNKLDSKIYNAYDSIYATIYNYNLSNTEIIKLYNFILNDIDISRTISVDLDYVSYTFEWENNRGKKLQDFDIIKNKILSNIKEFELKCEIYDEWEKIHCITYDNISYTDINQKIRNMAIQIYIKQINIYINSCNDYNILIQDEKTYNNAKKYINIIKKIHEIINKILKHRLYRLLLYKNYRINWNLISCLIIPIMYKKDKMPNELIELILAWHYRYLYVNNITNNIGYKLLNISNDYLNDKINYDDCIKKTKILLKETYDIPYKLYVDNILNYNWYKNKYNIKSLLLYYESKITYDTTLPYIDGELEHIIAINNKKILNDENTLNMIGNLTLLQKENSENGYAGNASLSDKSPKDKIKAYKNSDYKINIKLHDMIVFNNYIFNETHIIERSKNIYKEINDITNRYLL